MKKKKDKMMKKSMKFSEEGDLIAWKKKGDVNIKKAPPFFPVQLRGYNR